MSQDVCSDAQFRIVRDSEAGHYYLQAGFGNHFRSFYAFKLGKLDQLREQAKVDAQKEQAAQQQPQE